jgi:hypothetical protein
VSETTRARLRAATVAVAPVVLLAAFVWHPYLPGRLPNDAAIAAAVAADTTGWGLAHLAAGVGSGVVVLAFLAIRSYLREAGEDRWSLLGLPCIVMGSTLYTLLPGMEFAPLAAAEVGGDVQAAQAALTPWFVSVLVSGSFTFAVGVFAFARGIARSRVLCPGLTRLVVGALIVMAAARFIPLAAVQFYVQGAAGIVALWPLAYAMAKHPAARPTEQAGRVPVTAGLR